MGNKFGSHKVQTPPAPKIKEKEKEKSKGKFPKKYNQVKSFHDISKLLPPVTKL